MNCDFYLTVRSEEGIEYVSSEEIMKIIRAETAITNL